MASDVSLDHLATQTLQSINGMIFGRKAHAPLATFWPNAASNPGASPDLIDQARLMNTLPKVRADAWRRDDRPGQFAGDSARGGRRAQAIRRAAAGRVRRRERCAGAAVGGNVAPLPSGDYAMSVSPRTAAVLVSIRGAGTRRRFS